MAELKRLPIPRQKYYVDAPVVVIPLSQYICQANHLTDLALFSRKTRQEQVVIMDRNAALIKEMMIIIRAAKSYYRIVSTTTL